MAERRPQNQLTMASLSEPTIVCASMLLGLTEASSKRLREFVDAETLRAETKAKRTALATAIAKRHFTRNKGFNLGCKAKTEGVFMPLNAVPFTSEEELRQKAPLWAGPFVVRISLRNFTSNLRLSVYATYGYQVTPRYIDDCYWQHTIACCVRGIDIQCEIDYPFLVEDEMVVAQDITDAVHSIESGLFNLVDFPRLGDKIVSLLCTAIRESHDFTGGEIPPEYNWRCHLEPAE